ncbi:hypothetical protein AUP68_12981 [Ilyonectria robusta]
MTAMTSITRPAARSSDSAATPAAPASSVPVCFPLHLSTSRNIASRKDHLPPDGSPRTWSHEHNETGTSDEFQPLTTVSTDRSSYYKRSPRQGFVQRSFKQVKRLFRDLVHWAKRHPWKVFFLVIMPLITGGFLTALLARFGLRIPPMIERMLSTASKAASGDSVGLVGDAVRMASGGLGGGSSGGGLADMAKKFM